MNDAASERTYALTAELMAVLLRAEHGRTDELNAAAESMSALAVAYLISCRALGLDLETAVQGIREASETSDAICERIESTIRAEMS